MIEIDVVRRAIEEIDRLCAAEKAKRSERRNVVEEVRDRERDGFDLAHDTSTLGSHPDDLDLYFDDDRQSYLEMVDSNHRDNRLAWIARKSCRHPLAQFIRISEAALYLQEGRSAAGLLSRRTLASVFSTR